MKTSKRIFLIIAVAITMLIVAYVIITEAYAHKLPHHFASAKEGRELLLANTDYYANFSQNDIDYRLNRSGGTLDELLQASADEIKDFNVFERFIVDRTISKMVRKLEKNGYDLPTHEDTVYINTALETEGFSASGYTHGCEVYLNSTNVLFSILPEADKYFENLLWHELFHCVTRNNPGFRADMYSVIGFTVADHDFEIPPCLQGKVFSNPDVEHHDSYTAFNIDGRETECFLAYIVTEDYSGADLSSVSDVVLVPVDGTDTYYRREQASDFDEIFGSNTDYVIDPEECMADNFADAMQYGTDGGNGQGYPNPEIIQGIMEVVR